MFDISGTTAGASITSLSGSGAVALGNRTLTVTDAATTFSGVIAGSGGLTVAGGTLTLTGDNTYAGLTSIGSGATLRIGTGGTSGAVAGDFADNGTLVFNRSDTVTITGNIGGTGALTQLGTGTLVLLGKDTVSGKVTVASGTLEVGNAATPGAVLNASSGGVTVGAGATLEGHGTILGAVTNTAGGTVRPGGSIGTLTVGSYVQGANSTLAIEVSPTQSSLLQVTGTASIAGTVAVTLDPGTYASHVYPILTAASVTGTFSTLTASGAALPGLVYGLSYAPAGNEVDLVLASTKGTSVYGDALSAALDSADAYARTVLDHGVDCAGSDQASGGTACASNGVWLKALGSTGETDSTPLASGYSFNRGGFIGGIDRTVAAGIKLGVSFGWQHTSTNSFDYAASAKVDQYDFGLYTSVQLGVARIDADGFYGSSTNHVTRDTQGGGTALAQFNGRGYGGAVRLSLPLKDSVATPFAELRWTHQTRDGVAESGVGALDFAIARQSHDDGHAIAGLRIAPVYSAGAGSITPHLEIGVDQQIGQTDRTVYGTLASVTGANFAGAAVSAARTAALVKLGFNAQTSRSIEFFGDIDWKYSDNHNEGTANIGLRARF